MSQAAPRAPARRHYQYRQDARDSCYPAASTKASKIILFWGLMGGTRMPTTFDPGICQEPFVTLCDEAPDPSIFPSSSFRIEWGPIFHRGRLDGTARILCIGQDPAQNEAIVRRILIGVAGHRVQGFLAKLGIDRSYVMLNAFLYSAYNQSSAKKHLNDAAIAAYRNRWLSAVMASGSLEAVVAFGSLADAAWQEFTKSSETAAAIPYRQVP